MRRVQAGLEVTGPLVVSGQVADPAASVTITDDDHPSTKFLKTGAPAGKQQWRHYISGSLGAPADQHAMCFMPEIDDATDETTGAFRMYRDGRFRIGADPVNVDEVTTKRYVDGAGFTAYMSGSVTSNAAGQTLLGVTTEIAMWGGFTRSGGQFFVPAAGLYEVGFSGAFASNGSGSVRALQVFTNGGSTPAGQGTCGQYAPPSTNTSGLGASLSASAIWNLAAGVALTLYARQDSGAALAVNPQFWARRVL